MKFHIDETSTGLDIRVDGVEGKEQLILDTILQCKRSAWACPSGECLNIGGMDGQAEGGTVRLTLTAREGSQLSAAGIEQCLGYVLSRIVA